jgi:hypothetical protein
MPHDPLRVAPERSGWRDLGLSGRHRLWGHDCPATDIDFLEYDNGVPVALLEFKHERAERYRTGSANIRACRNLADRGKIPFFVIIRANDLSWFEINAENSVAGKMFRDAGLDCLSYTTDGGEEELVRFLYWLRGREPDNQVLERLATTPFDPQAARS